MINTRMRLYNYYTLSNSLDEYGQPQTIEAEGAVKMSIAFASESIQENPLYSGSQYVGLTLNKNIDATYIIEYEGYKLKVLYTNSHGRFNQVFMARM